MSDLSFFLDEEKSHPKGTTVAETLGHTEKTPWERSRHAKYGLRRALWGWDRDEVRRIDREQERNERKDFAEHLQNRMRAIRQVRNDDWPASYRDYVRKAFDSIPRGILVDFAQSDLDDDLVLSKVRAYVGLKVRQEVERRYNDMPDWVREEADFRAKRPSAASFGMGRYGMLPSEGGVEHQTLDRIKAIDYAKNRKSKRTPHEVETAQLAGVFGLSSDSVQNKVADAQGWLTDKILDNAAMDAMIKISEAPARALDWLAKQATGEDDITAGQAIFGRGNALSGTADAAKVFFLDTFVVLGKLAKGAKAARGLNRIDDMTDPFVAVEKGVNSAPVERFAKWWQSVPDEIRGAGFGDRHAEMFGWKVKPEAWERLRTARSTDDVKTILREEALGIGPSGAQNIEALPYLRPTHRVRKMWEGGNVGPVSINNPMLGAFRTTWGNRLDPSSPIFSKQLRRFGDYMWGVKTPTDEGARIVDRYVSQVTTNFDKASRTKLMGEMLEEGLTAFSTRAGATPQQAAEALERTRQAYPGFLGRTRRTAYGFEEGGAVIDQPFRQTQLANAVPVPSYIDVLAFKTELRDVMGKRFTGKVAKKMDDAAMHLTRGVIRVWLAKPSTLVRAGFEEATDLAGHPEFGRHFRRQLREQMLDSTAHLLHRGHPIRTLREAQGIKAKVRAGIDHVAGAVHPSAGTNDEMRREILASQQFRGYLGVPSSSLTEEMVQELARSADDLDLDLFHWMPVEATSPTFSNAWYHVVNHQVLQDPLSQIIVNYGDDLQAARSMGRMWLETPEGQRYLRQFAAPGEQATKLDDILDWHVADIERNIPPQLMPAAQGAVASGHKVSFDTLETMRKAGVNPSRVVGPVPVSHLPAEEAKILGYFQEGKIAKGLQKPYGWGATFADYMSRRPGWAAAHRYRKEGLERLRAARAKHGVDWGLSDEIIEKESTHYANREMWRMDNPLERSRSDYWLRNVSPFQYNQNNFMKRWGRRAVNNPGYVSRLRNMEGAMEDVGFIERDESGNLVFQIPISAEFWTNLVKKRDKMPEHYRRLAFSLGFAGTGSGAGIFKEAPFDLFRQMALPPGMPFAASVDPGLGPVLTIPVAAITAKKPEFDWLRNLVLGGYESWDPDKGWMHNVAYNVGAGWARDIGAAVSGSKGDRAYIGAVLDLTRYAAVVGDEDIFDPKNQKKHEDQAKWFFAFRALTKFAFPYSATTPVFMQEKEDFDKLVDEHGFEEGTKQFLDKYGNSAAAFMLSMTEGAQKKNSKLAPKVLLSTSAFGERFYRDNQGFFEDYPDVAGLFSFRKGDEYSPLALRRQMQRGQRQGRDLTQLWLELNVEAGLHEYFDEVGPMLADLRERGVAEEKVGAVKRLLVGKIDQLFPGTAEYLNGWSTRRGQTLKAREELFRAVKDERVGSRKDVAPLREFLSWYEKLDNQAKQMGYGPGIQGQKGTAHLRKALVHIYNKLFDATGSVALEKAYTYLFKFDLEDEETDG